MTMAGPLPDAHPPRQAPVGVPVRPIGAARAFLVERGPTIALALLLTLVWSTQFLAQPFVWRHWEPDEVLRAWLDLLGEYLLVALVIVLAASLVLEALQRRPHWPGALSAGTYVVAIVVAATAGELLLAGLGTHGAAGDGFELAEHVMRWSTAALAVTGLRLAWLRAVQADAATTALRRTALDTQAQLAALRLQGLRRAPLAPPRRPSWPASRPRIPICTGTATFASSTRPAPTWRRTPGWPRCCGRPTRTRSAAASRASTTTTSGGPPARSSSPTPTATR